MNKAGKAQILAFKPQGSAAGAEPAFGEEAATSGFERSQRAEQLRMIEAILFASAVPVAEKVLAERLADNADIAALMEDLRQAYAGRGVNLVRIGDHWAFRTADDLSFLLQREAVEQRRLSRAALEVLAIIAYHQPVTRAEIEEIRGVATSKGTLDVLLEAGWVRMRGRRRTPGRPVTYGTTLEFLDHFGLEELSDLPGLDELKGAGLLQSQLPANFKMPMPNDSDEPAEDEDPLTPEDLEELGLLAPRGGDEDG
ncbi:MAG: segregation and condensation protein B [Alphaproteobacteria bacterium]|nr:MAG: segregation and condensation protein B [Alphaproteobacteria bacterium]